MKNSDRSVLSVNLKRIRTIVGLTQQETAERAGISRNAYRSIECGKSLPRSRTLAKIANILGVEIFDLLKPIPEIKSLRFRAGKKLSQSDMEIRRQYIIDFGYWLQDFNALEKELKKKTAFTLAGLAGKSLLPIEMANEARKVLKISDNPVNDICDLVESAGIKIFLFSEFGRFAKKQHHSLKNFFGFSLYGKDGCPAIAVNNSSEISVERKIFTVAHELGHILLHPDSFDSDKAEENKLEEKEADIFASYFLMPDSAFKKELKKNAGLHMVHLVLHIKRIFKVSYKTVLKRLCDMGIADNSIWKDFALEYRKMFNENLKNHFEPDSLSEDEFRYEPKCLDSIDFIESKLSSLVREALERDIITLNKAAEILRKDIPSMREIVNSWKTAV